MPVQVEMPNGVIAEFPDGTPPETIKSVLAKKFPKQKPVAPDHSWEGLGLSFDKTVDGITDLYLKARGEDAAVAGHEANVAEKRRLDEPLRDSPSGQFGELAGDTLQLVGPGGAAIKGISKLPRYRAAAGVASTAAINAGFEGLKQPMPGESRADNAEAGAYYGAAGEVGGRVLGRAIRGAVKTSPSFQKLPQEVQDKATLGQASDRKSLSGRIASGFEEKLTSVPVIGDVVKNARQEGTDAWRDSIIKSVTPPGTQMPQGGNTRDVFAAIQDQFDTQYRGALDGTQVKASPAFEQRVARIAYDPKYGLSPEQADNVYRTTMNYYGTTMFPPTRAGQAIPGDQAKQFERFLSGQQRQHMMGNTPNSSNVAQAFGDIEGKWETAYRSQLPRSNRKSMERIDQQYAPYKTTERAATSVGNEEGAFTPAQLLNSVKARTAKPRFAAGEGMLQEQADAGKSVFQDRVPNSGTTDRAMNTAALAGVVLDPSGTAATLATMGALGLPATTTKLGKNMMTGNTKTQLMLKKLRADRMAEAAGLPLSQALEGLLEDQ